jgi:hypothetical protein
MSTTMRTADMRTWRGVFRGQLRQVKRRVASILRYDIRHPEVIVLTDADVSTCEAMVILCNRLLNQRGSPDMVPPP